MAHLGERDVLMVISDHGFSSFRRGVNLNSWLRREGYLVLNLGIITRLILALIAVVLGIAVARSTDWAIVLTALAIATAALVWLRRKRQARGVPVDPDLAMTGEITLSGLVLPVGGIREKALAARRHGIKTFVLPQMNEQDLAELPEEVRREMKFVPVRTLEEVLKLALPVPA